MVQGVLIRLIRLIRKIRGRKKKTLRGKRRKAIRGRKGKYTGDGDFFVRLSQCAE